VTEAFAVYNARIGTTVTFGDDTINPGAKLNLFVETEALFVETEAAQSDAANSSAEVFIACIVAS
jgi:hypothetical protein